jgi:malic enzyme
MAAMPGHHRPGEPLLPVVVELGPVSQRVAWAVVRAAQSDGVADRAISDDQVAAAVAGATWTPVPAHLR